MNLKNTANRGCARCLLEEGNITISIKGNARICKEQLSVHEHCAMVEVDITSIKSDVTRIASVISGIKCEIDEKYVEITEGVHTEMMN